MMKPPRADYTNDLFSSDQSRIERERRTRRLVWRLSLAALAIGLALLVASAAL